MKQVANCRAFIDLTNYEFTCINSITFIYAETFICKTEICETCRSLPPPSCTKT